MIKKKGDDELPSRLINISMQKKVGPLKKYENIHHSEVPGGKEWYSIDFLLCCIAEYIQVNQKFSPYV